VFRVLGQPIAAKAERIGIVADDEAAKTPLAAQNAAQQHPVGMTGHPVISLCAGMTAKVPASTAA